MKKRFLLVILLLLYTATFTSAQGSLLDKEITLDKNAGTVENILNELGDKGGFTFSYSNHIPLKKQVSLSKSKWTVKEILDEIFEGEQVEYLIQKDKVILKLKEKTDLSDQIKPKYTLSGFVKDSISGEVLIGSTIFIEELLTGASTNSYGFYSLTLPEGTYTIVASFVGYLPIKQKVRLTNHISLSFPLTSTSTRLSEVTISSSKSENLSETVRMGLHKLDVSTIKKIPALGGEADIMRSLQMLPGVNQVSEGSTGLFVRGGGMDQNVVLLDEAPVYNPSHLLGIFSVFNPDIIKDIKLYKGGIPAEYGGRLSSVLDIRMKEGNYNKFKFSGGIGLLTSRLTIEGPIIKERTSFIVSARRTYPDLVLLNLNPNISGSRLNFSDVNAKINHTINKNNKVFLSGFFGSDVLKLGSFYGTNVDWGNATGTLRWNHLFNEKLFSNFTLLYSKYRYNLNAYPLQWKSAIQDYSMKADFTWFPNPENTWKFGIQSKYLRINPGSSYREESSEENEKVSVPVRNALEHAIYLSNEHKINEKILVEYGLRYTLFQNVGKSTVFSYDKDYLPVDTTFYKSGQIFYNNGGLEPRLNVRYSLSQNNSIKASYNRTRQYLQLLSNTTTGFTTFDIWYPSGPTIKPQIADQVSLGYFLNSKENKREASAEVYYKNMQNTVEYADYASLIYNPYLDAELRSGKAWAYGAEFFIRKPTGRLTGWVSYNYSKTQRRIPEINNGNTFDAGFDIPHNFSLVSQYELSPRLSLSANWVYSTGRPVTLPRESYSYGTYHVPVFGGRNTSRLPDYNRLDASITLNSRKKPNRKFESSWTFSVYNVYARKNALLIFMGPPLDSEFPIPDELDKTKTVAHKVSLFPFIPSLTYKFKF